MQSRDDQRRIAKIDSKMIAKLEVKIVKNAFFECLHTISDARIERDENSDDEDEKIID